VLGITGQGGGGTRRAQGMYSRGLNGLLCKRHNRVQSLVASRRSSLAPDLLKAHCPLTDRAGLLALHPLVDACQVEVVVALGPDRRVVCTCIASINTHEG